MDLYDAARHGDLERVQALVEQGVNKNNNGRGYSPLYGASQNDYIAVVRYLVEHGADLENVNGHYSWTPLMIAAVNGYIDVVRYLLEQGANRDKVDINGWTSLHLAAYRGRLETAKLLMAYGADLNARDNRDRLPIDLARTEEIKQAIRDEPRRRLDEAPGKRATEEDRHPPNAATSASAQEEEEEDVEQSNKRQRLGEGEAQEENVAEEDQDSEPSSDENDN